MAKSLIFNCLIRIQLLNLLGAQQIEMLLSEGVLSADESRISHRRAIVSEQERKTKLLSLLLNSRLSSRDGRIRKVAIYEGGMTGKEMSASVYGLSYKKFLFDDLDQLRYRRVEFGRYSWDDVFRCLSIFQSLEGHLDVPPEYTIDASSIGEGYPQSSLGLDLGDAVMSLRIGDIDGYDDEVRRAQLDSIGFDWGDTTKRLHFRFVPTWLGMKHYHYIYGHNVIEWNYVVPFSEEWPFWMMGMPLGNWLWIAKFQHVLLAKEYPTRKELLDALNFKWNIPIGEKLLLDEVLFSKFNIN
jgi:hypothetical protein